MKAFLVIAMLLCFCSQASFAQLTVVLSKKDACAGAKNGTITLQITGANAAGGTVSVQIVGPPNFGPTSVPVDGTGSGTYTSPSLPPRTTGSGYFTIVQDDTDTDIQSTKIFDVSPGISASVDPGYPQNNTSCAAPDGAINISVSGGSGAYNYSWSGTNGFSATTQDISGLNAQTYSVAITDQGANCNASISGLVVTDPSPAVETVSPSGVQNFCAGNDATISLVTTEAFPVVYEIMKNGTATGVTANGTGGPITLTLPNGSFSNGDVLTVRATNQLCTPTTMNGSVTINIVPLPVPSLSGSTSVCAGTTGVIYTTDAGMTNYVWNVSAGGTITSGGGATDNTVTVTWNTAGANTVSVNYKNSNGCTAASPTSLGVTVNARPVPTNAGLGSVCVGATGVVYTTDAGMSNYVWVVSAGGTVTAGGGAANNTVTVTWNTAGAQTVSVNYTDANGCTAASPTVKNVTVNSLPVPSLAGSTTVCAGTTGVVYTTDAGMSNYVWTISAGGTITAGGGAGNNTVTVTWNTAGAQTVSVNYSNAANCTATSPTVLNVTVNPVPTPSLSGTTSLCAGTTGVVYTTDAGMSIYVWTVSAGGTVTAGGTATDNTVTVTWNTAGAQTVSVNYSNAFGCSAPTPTSLGVTVNPLPTPTISGSTSVCVGSSGNVYTTEAGKSNYTWLVSAGGTITAGGTAGSNTVTVKWNTAGAQTVSVNYTDVNGCTAASPTVKNITVNSLPVPSLAGPTPVCAGTAGSVYTTDAGMSNYVWTVSAGGTITAGGTSTDNTVTVTWNTAGARSVKVNYTDANGCAASSATTLAVTVRARPNPTLTGSTTVCAGTSGVVYTTNAGQTNYVWNVSAGGTITAGGGSTNNTVTVTWNTAGAQTVSVDFTNAFGCTALAPKVLNVTVNPLPVPTLSGSTAVCAGSTGNVYTTDAGMSNYVWTVSAGGTITAGGAAGNNTVTVTWNTAGPQTVSVNYTDANGCVASSPTVANVTVSAAPTPSLAGSTSVCAGTTGVVYTTDAGMSNYVWTVSAGGTITAGGAATDNTVTVTWNTAGAQTVTVNYTNGGGCPAPTPTSLGVTVNALPVPSLVGSTSVCAGATGNVYTTDAGMSNYVWTVSGGGTITAGGAATDNTVTIKWNTAGPQTVSVNYTNASGCTATTATTSNVTVNALPVPALGGSTAVCAGSTGNVYTTDAGMSNYVWTVSAGGTITAGGTAGSNTVTVTWNTAGAQTVSVNYTDANGCVASSPTVANVTVSAAPIPSLAGSTSVCAGTTGVVYTTDAGMSNYVWTVSAGGTITAGGAATDNTVTVTWNTAGAQTVTVNYTNGGGCSALTPTSLGVTVNALPVPSLAGSTTVCAGATGNVYTTDAGMSNYVWTVSAGGTITAGGAATDNTITITWNTAGPQTVSVNYTNASGCTASTATTSNVTVNALPVPILGGSTAVCAGSTGNVYTTDPGMSNYIWTVSAGGTITAGGAATDNTVTITWSSAGPQTVSVNYTNASGCTATTPTTSSITVNALPVPSLAGPLIVCAGATGNVYTTDAGMSNYVWTVSAGGIITAGGSAASSTVTIKWTTAGPQTVSVNYKDANGCVASSATVANVTVNSLPVPSLTGSSNVCEGATGVVYSTDPGMTNYVWTVSAGGTITAGGAATDNTVTITWNTPGSQTVKVNYTDVNACTASTATTLNVNVNNASVPSLAGSNTVCIGGAGTVYTTDAGMSNYVWTVSAGGTITAGGTAIDNTVTVTWNTAGPQTVSVSYTDTNGCTAVTPTVRNVTVNPSPTPSLTGSILVCAGPAGITYQTDAGMSNYVWTVSAGGTVTGGGGINNRNITIKWTTGGPQTVSVNYTDASGCSAPTPTVKNVTVNPQPVPTLSGSAAVCSGATGGVYTSDAGMSNYVWVVSSGGVVTAGGTSTDNTITIDWPVAGSQTVSVSYTDGNGCTPASPTVLNVNVGATVTPSLTGASSSCVGATGVVYTTDAGQTNYVWNVSAGGTITAGGTATDNTVTVTWNTAGPQTVDVDYTAPGCPALSPTNLNVTVNTTPTPGLTGPTTACGGSTGNVYTTDPGMSNYVWTVSAGGTITAGGSSTDNTVTVTWNATGPQTVSVNYTNAGGCSAASPVSTNVTVDSPTPSLTGTTSLCAGSTGVVYSTDAGMSNYVWTISAGGTITAGGAATDNTVTVTWNTAGPQTVSVNYTDAAGCSALLPTVSNVTVNAQPSPTLSGSTAVCTGATGVVYSTDAGMSNYVWVVSAGGTVTAGGASTDNTITIDWPTAGAQTVSVSYTDANGCTPASPTISNVTVGPSVTPTLNGSNSVCTGATGVVYATDAGMSNYVWTVSAGGTITAGGTATDNTVTVTWNTAGSQTVDVNYTAPGCTPGPPTTLNVTVGGSPTPGLSGTTLACKGSTGNVYSTDIGMSSYVWTVSAGGTITSGGAATDNTVTVTWATNGPQTVSVSYTSGGCASTVATKNVTVLDSSDPACMGGTGTCATVVIDPKPTPATCANSDGSIFFDIQPAVPAVNNIGVIIQIVGPVSDTKKNQFHFDNYLPAGTYTYTILYGDSSCTSTGFVTIDQSGTVGTPTVSEIVPPTCFGAKTGSARITVNNQAPGDLLEWSLDGINWTSFINGSVINGLPAGPSPSFNLDVSIRKNSSDLCYAKATINIQSVNPALSITYNTDAATCNSNDGVIRDLTGVGGSGSGYTFSVDSSDFGPGPFAGLSGGSHQVVVMDGSGCKQDSTVKITFPGFIDFNTATTNATCDNPKGGEIDVIFAADDHIDYRVGVSNDPLVEPTNYLDDPSNAQIFPIKSLTAGTYYVFVKAPNSTCPTRVGPVPVGGTIPITFTLDPSCTDNKVSLLLNNIKASLSSDDGGLVLTVLDNLDQPVVDGQNLGSPPAQSYGLNYDNPSYAPFLQIPGEYQIFLSQIQTSSGFCQVYSDTVDYVVHPPLFAKLGGVSKSDPYPEDATGTMQVVDINGGQPPYSAMIELIAASDSRPSSFQTNWETVTLNKNLQYEKDYSGLPAGSYKVLIADSVGCVIKLDPEVVVPLNTDLFIPNIFTPNGDGSNEEFFIRNLPAGEKSKLVITNRWGKEVYSSDDYQNTWTGEGASDGIYFYSLKIGGAKPITGWVEILRGYKP